MKEAVFMPNPEFYNTKISAELGALNDEVNDGDNFINEPGQENVINNQPLNHINIGQPQAQADQNPINDDVPPEADYSEILRTLRGTESFWQRETKSYKDFKNALTNLNNGMRASGERALNSEDVQKLRLLAAKAKESWNIYSGQIWAAFNEGVERGENNVSPLDRRRMSILRGMGGFLNRDLDSLRNYDPTRNMNLPQLIQETAA